jgi:hypothetical protein
VTILRLTATIEYELPDTPTTRAEAYGTLDTAECIAIDLEQAGDIVVGHISQGDEVTYAIVRVPVLEGKRDGNSR